MSILMFIKSVVLLPFMIFAMLAESIGILAQRVIIAINNWGRSEADRGYLPKTEPIKLLDKPD